MVRSPDAVRGNVRWNDHCYIQPSDIVVRNSHAIGLRRCCRNKPDRHIRTCRAPCTSHMRRSSIDQSATVGDTRLNFRSTRNSSKVQRWRECSRFPQRNKFDSHFVMSKLSSSTQLRKHTLFTPRTSHLVTRGIISPTEINSSLQAFTSALTKENLSATSHQIWTGIVKSPTDAIQACISLFLLVFLSKVIEPVSEFLWRTLSFSETDNDTPWKRSTWSWVVQNIYPPIYIGLVIDVVGRAASIIIANTGDKSTLAAFITDYIARPSLIGIVYLIGGARLVINWLEAERKRRSKEAADPSEADRVQGAIRVGIIVTLIGTILSALHLIGIDIGNLITIGGFSGIAIGLAGRQFAESFLAGLMMYTNSPFDKGELIKFKVGGIDVQGTVVDIGVFRTCVRSSDREIFTVPNASIFSSVVLNKSRRYAEWRMNHSVCLRPVNDLMDISSITQVVAAMRECVRQHPFVISTLPQRIHLSEIKLEGYIVTITCYIKARDMTAFFDNRESLLEEFIKICAEKGTQVVVKELDIS